MSDPVMTPAQVHASLVDKVLAIPAVAENVKRGQAMRVCPRCWTLYEWHGDVACHKCYGRLNRFAMMAHMYEDLVPIEHAPDEALRDIISYFEEKAAGDAQNNTSVTG